MAPCPAPPAHYKVLGGPVRRSLCACTHRGKLSCPSTSASTSVIAPCSILSGSHLTHAMPSGNRPLLNGFDETMSPGPRPPSMSHAVVGACSPDTLTKHQHPQPSSTIHGCLGGSPGGGRITGRIPTLHHGSSAVCWRWTCWRARTRQASSGTSSWPGRGIRLTDTLCLWDFHEPLVPAIANYRCPANSPSG